MCVFITRTEPDDGVFRFDTPAISLISPLTKHRVVAVVGHEPGTISRRYHVSSGPARWPDFIKSPSRPRVVCSTKSGNKCIIYIVLYWTGREVRPLDDAQRTGYLMNGYISERAWKSARKNKQLFFFFFRVPVKRFLSARKRGKKKIKYLTQYARSLRILQNLINACRNKQTRSLFTSFRWGLDFPVEIVLISFHTELAGKKKKTSRGQYECNNPRAFNAVSFFSKFLYCVNRPD